MFLQSCCTSGLPQQGKPLLLHNPSKLRAGLLLLNGIHGLQQVMLLLLLPLLLLLLQLLLLPLLLLPLLLLPKWHDCWGRSKQA
jgi:hypothetical protein